VDPLVLFLRVLYALSSVLRYAGLGSLSVAIPIAEALNAYAAHVANRY
jgi:hypothetical protein